MSGFNILDPNLDLNRNYFIEASAGTGKTFTIENIVVRLIERAIPVHQILVVTFTRAATLELKTRIRRTLENKKMRKELLAFDEAKIFTIHGFCFQTLKEHAFETGFSLLQKDESTSIETYKRIFKDFLRTGLKEEEIHPKQWKYLLNRRQNEPLNILKTMSRSFSVKGRSFSEILKDIEDEIKRLNCASQPLFSLLTQYASWFGTMCDRKKRLKPEVEEGLFRFSQLFEKLEPDKVFDLPILKMVPENLLKNKGIYPELLEQLNHKLIPLLGELSNSEMILSFIKAQFQTFLQSVCKQEDIFFYDDLLVTMQKCVHNSLFAEKIRSCYRCVLIDEFQDTDHIQWDIFSTLFFGHIPLYLVGDPKQSIYRFRGADLYTYMAAKKMMGDASVVTLTSNFRSEPGLIHALNALFSKTERLITLPKSGETLEILPLIAALPQTEDGKVIFCQASDEKALFAYIYTEIEYLHQSLKLPYCAFAVLVKDHNQAKRFCSQCPLPFANKKSGSLLETDAISCLEDLLIAVYNPRERHAVVKALGGILFNVPLEKLPDTLESAVEKFHQYHVILRTEGILRFFKELAKNVSFTSESLYLDCLQLVELIAENTHSFEEYLPFLYKLKREDPESDKLKVRAKGEDAIQVMTIHVSKGLEFAVVFPIGLISAHEMSEIETVSDNMRQLYVAVTRAKKRLYLPLSEKTNTPIHFFLSQVLGETSLEDFVKQSPYFSVVDCNQKRDMLPSDQLEKKTAFSLPLSSVFPECFMHSFSSLATKSNYEPVHIKEGEIPAGIETGIIVHRILEKLDFSNKNLRDFIFSQIKDTHLELYVEAVEKWVEAVLQFPLEGPHGPFCLAEVNPKKIKRELEFLYPEGQRYIKGFIDLFFEHEDYFYIIDWKTNCINTYESEDLHQAMVAQDYLLQANLYKTAIGKYLKLFNLEERFFRIFFVFLRGLDATTRKGVYSFEGRLS